VPRAQVAAALDRLHLRGAHLLVAVSGGVDSTVMLHLLAGLRASHGLTLGAAYVDHGLRGEASQREGRFVERTASALGIESTCEVVDPQALRAAGSSRRRPTLQEAARQLRYTALEAAAARTGADHIATAHTLDDQAETVLLRLLRGCGPDALGGIAERAHGGLVVRPLLTVSRQQVLDFAHDRALAWCEDASNARDDYTRNRLRHHWLPGLARDFNPRLLMAIANLAEGARRDAEWIASSVGKEARARIAWREGRLEVLRSGWDALPEALARRLVRCLFEEIGEGRELSRVHIERVLGFVRDEAGEAGRWIELPGGHRLVRERAVFGVTTAAAVERRQREPAPPRAEP